VGSVYTDEAGAEGGSFSVSYGERLGMDHGSVATGEACAANLVG
jgi:hypothetical protein